MKTITERHLPFRLRKIVSGGFYVIDSKEYTGVVEIRPQVGCSNPDEEKAIGDFIVRACNHHEALVAALDAAWELLGNSDVRFKICDGGRGNLGEQSAYMRAQKAQREVPDLDAIPRQDKTPSMASKVCSALQARNVLCHLEYQDWINIPMGDEFYWAFGDMNEYWEGNFNTSDGNHLAAITLDFRNDHQSDGKDIADAIYEALRRFRHHAFGAPPFEPNES